MAGMSSRAYFLGIPSTGSSYKTHRTLAMTVSLRSDLINTGPEVQVPPRRSWGWHVDEGQCLQVLAEGPIVWMDQVISACYQGGQPRAEDCWRCSRSVLRVHGSLGCACGL